MLKVVVIILAILLGVGSGLYVLRDRLPIHPPQAQFSVMIVTTREAANPSDGCNDELLTISDDGLRQVLSDDRTDLSSDVDGSGCDTGSWVLRTVLQITSLRGDNRTSWSQEIVIASVDSLDASGENIVKRQVNNNTLFQVVYANDTVPHLDTVKQSGDGVVIGSNYTETGNVHVDAQVNIAPLVAMKIGMDYCIGYTAAGIMIQSCIRASLP